jgi:hypothetical protein
VIWIVLVAAAVASGWALGEGDAARNWREAAAGAPADLLGALLGATVGLYGRERIRLRRTYASPTTAFLGKRLLYAAFAAAATLSCSPVAWPAESMHAFAAAAAAGAAAWVGNLPPKL